MQKLCLLLLLTALFVPYCLFSQQQSQPLTNKDVLEMLKGGLTPEIVVAKIKVSPCDFDTSPDALKALKASNVPDAVILSMVQALAASRSGIAQEGSGRSATVTCVNAKEVALLSSPGTLPPIAHVKCGEAISVLEEKDPWDRVRTADGRVGYISNFFVPKETEGRAQVGAGETQASSSSPSSTSTLPPNELRAIAWRAVPWVTTSYYQQPGSAYTDCTGSGTWLGNIWQGNSSCTTQYTPAQNVPINWTHYTIYNLVETADSRLVIACTRNWAFSKCSYLIPSNVFPYENKNGQILVSGRRGGKNKEQVLKYDIVSSEPKLGR